MREEPTLLTLETIRQYLGERAARRLSAALKPKLDRGMLEGARRYIRGVPGDRIRRLKDRAAFAAAMAELVRADLELRRLTLRLLSSMERKERAESHRRRESRSKSAA